MDINTYLTNLSKQLALTASEKEKIDKSLDYLIGKVWSVFRDKLISVAAFGSYDRGTMLSNTIAKDSDVDVMITFKANEFQPETYLKQLRNFGETTYPRSEVSPEHPTIMVDLQHIRFELVPAYIEERAFVNDKLMIPASPGKDIRWIETDPEAFKTSLIQKNKEKKGQTIQIIKILKYWNALNNYPFKPYTLEKVAVNENVSGANIKEFFYDFVNEFSDYEMTTEGKKAFESLKEGVRKLKALEKENISEFIETSIASLLPMPS